MSSPQRKGFWSKGYYEEIDEESYDWDIDDEQYDIMFPEEELLCI